jgi:hypothetical protein
LINHIVLNKSKKKSIIFIHGLYANAGFWLPYLHYFKDYRLILLNCDYGVLINSKDDILHIQDSVKNLFVETDIIVVIAHSFGTILSGLLKINSSIKIFHICPVASSTRIRSEEFIYQIQLKINDTHTNIKNSLLLVDKLIVDVKDYLNENAIMLFPDQDQYFQYFGNEYVYVGNHFDIENALLKIMELI